MYEAMNYSISQLKRNALATLGVALFSFALFALLTKIENGSISDSIEAASINAHRFLLLFLPLAVIANFMAINTKSKLQTALRFRWLIAALLFVVCVICDINGSSIGLLSELCGGQDNPLLGVSRGIRSDEWMIFTPMSISQCTTDGGVFSYYQDSMRSVMTDMYIVYGQPVLDPAIIFRPFQIGFLFLGASRGLSFFWCGRVIFLFFVSFEFARRVLRSKSNSLNLSYSLLVTFSGLVQWWFAVNGLVEMLLFGQLALIWLSCYALSERFSQRCLYALGIGWCLSSFLLALYPAWEIPLAYVFLALLVGMIFEQRVLAKVSPLDLIPMFIMLCFIIISLGYVFLIQSWDTVQTITNTAYPGDRNSTGGGAISLFFAYILAPILPLDANAVAAINSNACESASFYSAFPLSLILPLCLLMKERGRSPMLVGLLLVCALLLCYSCYGLPEPIAQLTLLSKTTAYRAPEAAGFGLIVLLFYCLGYKERPSCRVQIAAYIASFLIILISVFVFFWNMRKAYIVMSLLIAAVFFFASYYAVNQPRRSSLRRLPVLGYAIVALLCGAFVNPVNCGIQGYLESPLTSEMSAVSTSEDVWITIDDGIALNNVSASLGYKTLNSTNTYPQLDTWEKIDPKHEYEDVYDRYANILISLKTDGEAQFELIADDLFQVTLTAEDLRGLGVTKVLATKENDLLEIGPVAHYILGDNAEYYIYDLKARQE